MQRFYEYSFWTALIGISQTSDVPRALDWVKLNVFGWNVRIHFNDDYVMKLTLSVILLTSWWFMEPLNSQIYHIFKPCEDVWWQGRSKWIKPFEMSSNYLRNASRPIWCLEYILIFLISYDERCCKALQKTLIYWRGNNNIISTTIILSKHSVMFVWLLNRLKWWHLQFLKPCQSIKNDLRISNW